MGANGIDADHTLGLFTGALCSSTIEIPQRLPPQIILFLDSSLAIRAQARGAGLFGWQSRSPLASFKRTQKIDTDTNLDEEPLRNIASLDYLA